MLHVAATADLDGEIALHVVDEDRTRAVPVDDHVVLNGRNPDAAGAILLDSNAAGDALHENVTRAVAPDRDIALDIDDLHRPRSVVEDDDVADDFRNAEIAGAVSDTHGTLHVADRDLTSAVSHFERTSDILDLEIAGAVGDLRRTDIRNARAAARVLDADCEPCGQPDRDIELGRVPAEPTAQTEALRFGQRLEHERTPLAHQPQLHTVQLRFGACAGGS